MAKEEIHWQAPEFEYHHKGDGWYWIVVLVTIILIAISLWTANFLFAIFLMVASFLFLHHGSRVPRYLDFRLTNEAVEIEGRKSYPYSTLEGFSTHPIDDLKDGLTEIVFKQKHKLGTYIKMLAPTQHIEEIRHHINDHLPEIEHEDSLADHVWKLLRF